MKAILRISLILLTLFGMFMMLFQESLASDVFCRWQLTFDDHFNAPTLDTTKWNTQYPSGNTGEQQFYAPDAFSVQDGVLFITAEKRSMNDYPYTSGIITTQQSFSQKYGYFTIRAKLPSGQGFWPAFWLLPAEPDYPTEIDVFEMLGGDAQTIYMSHHWKGEDRYHEKLVVPFQGMDFTSDFHTFSVLWSPSNIVWDGDGIERWRTTEGSPNTEMFMLANLAVGGEWPGYPDNTTPFPSSMQIDYIQAYQYVCDPGWAGIVNRLGMFFHEYAYEPDSIGKYHN